MSWWKRLLGIGKSWQGERCDACQREVHHPECLCIITRPTRQVCRQCYEWLHPPCPYCQSPFGKRPQAKTKCRNCGNAVRVRGSDLVTEEQAIKLDRLEDGALWRFDEAGPSHTFTKVAGVTRRNKDRTSRQKIIRKCLALERLDLQAEPENPYDSNAVAVLRETGEQIGYLNAELAEAVSHLAGRGLRFVAFVTQITGQGTGTLGVNLVIISAPPDVSDAVVKRYVKNIEPE